MITEDTLNDWLDCLDKIKQQLKSGNVSSTDLIKEIDWLVYDGRKDIASSQYDLPGMFSKEDLEEKIANYEDEISELQDDSENLQDENDILQDQVDDLEQENEDLKTEIDELKEKLDNYGIEY